MFTQIQANSTKQAEHVYAESRLLNLSTAEVPTKQIHKKTHIYTIKKQRAEQHKISTIH